jgi:hypothetical protein
MGITDDINAIFLEPGGSCFLTQIPRVLTETRRQFYKPGMELISGTNAKKKLQKHLGTKRSHPLK